MPFDTYEILMNEGSIVNKMDNLNLKLNKYAFLKTINLFYLGRIGRVAFSTRLNGFEEK